MSPQQPSPIKVWAQMRFGKALFKVYQVKTTWVNRCGRKSPSDAIQEDETTTSIE